MTDNRNIILDMINKSETHLTAEEIFVALKNKSYKIALPTVYNNLNSLYRDELIRKVSIEGQPDRYDKITKHDHLICKRCGKLSDFKFQDLTNSLNEQLSDSIIAYDLKVIYICPDCKNSSQ